MNKIVCLLAIAVGYANAIQFPEDRLLNGNLAGEFQFPYMASLQQIGITTDLRGHRCGGVLVTHQHVVTSASCLFTNVAGVIVPINATAHRIFAGSSILSNDNVPDRTRFIANFTIHPEYLPAPALLNDIAIITLTQPFTNVTVTPLQLFANGSTFNPPDFTICTVSGWGAFNNSVGATASPQLRFASKYIYNQDVCTHLFNSGFGPNIFPSMVCAASFDIVSVSCVGDYGNPLVCGNMLTGLLIGHNGCAVTSQPELYTRISNYTVWIRSITGSSASTFTPGIFMLSLLVVFHFITSKFVF